MKGRKMKEKYTLEKHLQNLSQNNETNHSLESVYNLQKRKLTRYLSSVVTTYPTYSTHDTWHSANIISSIENILGKDRIKKMTGIDTFLILMCAYMHDLGMLYTEQEVRDLWRMKEFQKYLMDCRSEETAVGKAARLLIDKEKCNHQEWPLDVKQAITIVLMDYFRPQHGKRIAKLTEKTNKIGELLCVEDSFLPSRIIKIINKISMAHTDSFQDMLNSLTMVDTFAGEEFHPRLIAWLLRMGDLCDLDNDRFNKVGIATFGTLQDDNLAHYFKHCSIETLYVSMDKIQIVANVDKKAIKVECETEWMEKDAKNKRDRYEERWMNVYQQTIREHINWKDWMQHEINAAKLNVGQIFPKNWSRKIPEIEYKILLNGKEITAQSQNLRFSFSTQKAYSLIENISIYQNMGLIFLRELIQNAIDATKIQIWREIKGQIHKYKEEISPFEVEREFPDIFQRHSIKISMRYHASDDSVNFSIEDSGIGISVQEFQNHILKTGNSWKNRSAYKSEFENMPEWLKPTGAFGIGLHTVFTVTDEMKIYTKSDQEVQTNEMILCSGKKSGYAFCQSADESRPRGTKIMFKFHLNSEQKQQCFEEINYSYLKDYGSEYEKIVAKKIEEYCKTPLFPIEFNNTKILSSLTESEKCIELTTLKKDSIYGKVNPDDRFEYCFGHDFKYIEIYDKRTRYFMNIQVRECSSINRLYSLSEPSTDLAFMGMGIDDEVNIKSKSIQLRYLDILSGDGSDTIDASRMKLTYSAKQKIESNISSILDHAKEFCLELMKKQRQDKKVIKYRADLTQLANEYYANNISMNELWNKTCKLKAEIFPANSKFSAKSIEVRTVTYLIGLNLVDEILKKDIMHIKKMAVCKASAKEIMKTDIKAFLYLDYILQKWKCDWKGDQSYFLQPYFDDQLMRVLDHYCIIWAHVIIEFALRGKIIRHNSVIRQFCDLLLAEFENKFPHMSKWKLTVEVMYDNQERILDYCTKSSESGRRYYSDAMMFISMFSGSVEAFEKWEYRGGYANNVMLSLEIGQPYLLLFLDLLSESKNSTLEIDVWNLYIKDSICNLFSFGILYPQTIDRIFERREVTILRRNVSYIYNACPFLENYVVNKVENSSGGWKIRLRLQAEKGRGIQADPILKKRIYKMAWHKIINEVSYDEDEIAFLAFEEYADISQMEKGDNIWLGINCRYATIPGWDYKNRIAGYALDCQNKEFSAKECVDGIIKMGLDKKVVNYLWITNTDGSEEAREKISQLYRSFLLELFEAFVEEE